MQIECCDYYRVRGQYHQTFNKDVILLTNPTWATVCTHHTKEQLYRAGNILSAFEFDKSWTYHTIIAQIRHGFGDKIPPDIRYGHLHVWVSLYEVYSFIVDVIISFFAVLNV